MKRMAELSSVNLSTISTEHVNPDLSASSIDNTEDGVGCPSFSGMCPTTLESDKEQTLHNRSTDVFPEIDGQTSTKETNAKYIEITSADEAPVVLVETCLNSSKQCMGVGKKETSTMAFAHPFDTVIQDGVVCDKDMHTPPVTPIKNDNIEDGDRELMRRAQEQGRVDVVFPGTVNQEGCCRFVSEILKCILYQRQQLPMTYDQLVYSQKKQQSSMQNKEVMNWRPIQSKDMDWRKCWRTLQELEEVLQQLEVLFSLSLVPRVLLLLGGSLVLPKELYEINMEALVLGSGDQSLRVSSCLRQLFRTLFVADLLSDARPVCLMATSVLVLAHRDCGVGWFRPKLDFKVPTRVKNQIIAMSTAADSCRPLQAQVSDWQCYVWFQAPMTIKGVR